MNIFKKNFSFGIFTIFNNYLIFRLLLLVLNLVWLSCSDVKEIKDYISLDSLPNISPDYSDIILPPNIAPANFIIQEKGEKFAVKIYSDKSDGFVATSHSNQVAIPQRFWQKFLKTNNGESIYFEIYVLFSDGLWRRYKRITNHVAKEPIDRYLVYRFLRPNYTVQKEMNIRQRDLQNFDDHLIMTTKTISACINCHSFNNNDPSSMLFHIRWGVAAGTIFSHNGQVYKVDTRTDFNTSPGAYASWHPNGKLVAFSINKVYQIFHANGESRDVIDISSDLITYDIDSNMVSSDPHLADPFFLETYPNWSPDGKFLYFCRAQQLNPDVSLENQYKDIKYDIVRIAYEPENRVWGTIDTLFSAAQFNLSAAHIRSSPDGKFLVFCLSKYGNFPIFRESSDLYLLNFSTLEVSPLAVNSDRAEGYHSWSSNSHWLVFTSKRDNGVYTRLYISHIDDNGNASKPFILPIKNPNEYPSLFYAFSVPELIKQTIPFGARQFIKTAIDPSLTKKADLDPNISSMKIKQDNQYQTTDYP